MAERSSWARGRGGQSGAGAGRGARNFGVGGRRGTQGWLGCFLDLGSVALQPALLRPGVEVGLLMLVGSEVAFEGHGHPGADAAPEGADGLGVGHRQHLVDTLQLVLEGDEVAQTALVKAGGHRRPAFEDGQKRFRQPRPPRGDDGFGNFRLLYRAVKCVGDIPSP
jgi:hypothetical protein